MSDGNRPVADQIPATIGRYQITGSLGYGAMGAVYKAFDPLIKRPLAIKTVRLDIPRSSPQYRSFIDRFQHEAQISGTLSHPAIVTLFDLGDENGLPYFAMEFVDGKTVADVIAGGMRFKPEKVISLVSQVAAALDYAHSRGVVHRDIKPANLILYDSDKVKVTDFGIAKLADADITHAGALLGTPSYMSPEQAMGEKLDGRSDIFSLGVVAFEMLSGQQPFPGPNVTSILYKLVHVPPIEPADLEMNGLVPHKWHEVFSKVLSKKPEQRYQTASAFVQDLEYCLGSWWSGLGDEETLTIAPEAGEVPTIEIQRPTALAVPAPPRGAAAPVLARDLDIETLLMPREAVAAAAGPAAEATILLDPFASVDETPPTTLIATAAAAATAWSGAAEIHPDSTMRPQPVAAAPSKPPRARPGIPLALVLGGAAAALVVVALGAWLLRPQPQEPASPVPAPESAPSEAPEAPPPAPVAAFGSLRVVSDPAGARVLVDGRARGRAPLELAELAFGSYEVRVEQSGYEPQKRRVELDETAPSAELRLTLARRAPTGGSADFLSTPPGAAVSVDGTPAGETPLRGVKLAAGKRRVEIALEGHETWSSTLDVVSGETGKVDVRLIAIPKAPPPTPDPVDVARVYPNEAGEVDMLARKLSGLSPSYPAGKAPRLKSGQRASVLVRFVVSETGEVSDVVVVESAGKVVDDVVVAAVRGWKFEPATKGGVRVKVETSFRQTFLGA
jgi:TonB family protein